MKKIILSFCLAFALGLIPVSAEKATETEASSTQSAFFTQSEADALEGNKVKMHPVVWVFVAGGVGALALTAVIVNMGRNKRD